MKYHGLTCVSRDKLIVGFPGVTPSCFLLSFDWHPTQQVWRAGLAGGAIFKINSQVVGFVAFDNIGSIVQIGDVNAINWISGANDMGDIYT